jgi:hypothetical protein
MPLPTRHQTFFETCREVLEKLDREIDRYRDVAGTEDELDPERLLQLVNQLKDSAFNAAVTAWQLNDWVFNELSAEQRKRLDLEKLSDLQQQAREQCRALHLCRQVATASKHWAVNQHPDPNIRIVITADGGWRIDFLDGHTTIPADQVFTAARDFWTRFIYGHAISKE